MAFTTGTATDHHDLLDKLRLYLVAQGWTQLAWTAPGVITSIATLNVRGPGAGAGKQVFVNIQSDNNPAINAYGWKVRGATAYSGVAPWGMQPEECADTYFNLWPNTIDYWFYVNDRRFMVVAKIGVIYLSMHAGFFLPFALPDEYPFPLYIASNTNSLRAYNASDSDSRFFVDPGVQAAFYKRRLTGDWAALRNHLGGTNNLDAVFNENSVHMWPHRCARGNGNNSTWEYRWLNTMKPNLSGELPMFTPHIIDNYMRRVAGVLDGVYVTGGFNRTAEQTVTWSGRTFRLFPNIFRSRPKDFMAIEEV